MRRLPVPLGLVAAVLLAAPLGAQQVWTTEFLIIKAKDTLAIERFTRDAATLTIELTQSNGLRSEFLANLRADNTVEHLEMSRKGLQGPAATLSVDFADTSVTASAVVGEKTQGFKLGGLTKPFPFLLNSFALFEQMAKTNKLEVGKSKRITAVRLGAGDTSTVTLTRMHADSLMLDAPAGAIRMKLSADGDILGAIFPAAQWVIERRKAK